MSLRGESKVSETPHTTNQPSVHYRSRLKARIALVCIVIAVLLAVVCVSLVLINQVSERQSYAHAAQDDAALLEEEENSTEVTRATYPIVNLVDLMGMTQDQTINALGHGATVERTSSLDAMGYAKEVTIALADERASVYAGTPTVVVWLNSQGQVQSASYQAPTSLLGYGSLSFISAIEDEDIVDYVLSSVGLTSFDTSQLALPDKSQYSTYESDRKTLASEEYTFSGQGSAADQAYTWSVMLTYDYTQANETGNLANTIKQVHVTLTPLAE